MVDGIDAMKKAQEIWRQYADELVSSGLDRAFVFDSMLIAAVTLQADARGLAGAVSYLDALAKNIAELGAAVPAAGRAEKLSTVTTTRH